MNARCLAHDCRQRPSHRIPIRLSTRGIVGPIFADVCTDHYRNWIRRAIRHTHRKEEQGAVPAA